MRDESERSIDLFRFEGGLVPPVNSRGGQWLVSRIPPTTHGRS